MREVSVLNPRGGSDCNNPPPAQRRAPTAQTSRRAPQAELMGHCPPPVGPEASHRLTAPSIPGSHLGARRTPSLLPASQAARPKARGQQLPDCLGEPKPPGGETPPLGLPRRAWPRHRRPASGHPLTAGPRGRPTRAPLVSLSSPWASRLARPQGPAREGRVRTAASREWGGGAGSAGPGRARFRVPGPAGKPSRRGRPLPGWRLGAELRFTCSHLSGGGWGAAGGWEAGRSSRGDPGLRLGLLRPAGG